jgi:hypothetical protein
MLRGCGHRARECERLARQQCLQSRDFDLVDMHQDIEAAVIRQNETKSAICVEEFNPQYRNQLSFRR